MKIFVAGRTGAVGKSLVPLLLESGHEVIALSRTSQKANCVNALDKEELTTAIRRAEPAAIKPQILSWKRISR